MASFKQSDDIFSPVKFGSSLGDSSESNLSLTVPDIEHNLLEKFSGLDSKEANDVFSPLSGNQHLANLSKKSSFLLSQVSMNRSLPSPVSRRSSGLQPKNLGLRKSSLIKNAFAEKERSGNENKIANDFDTNDVQEQDVVTKKLIRPTTLSPLIRWSDESCISDLGAAEEIDFSSVKKDAGESASNPENHLKEGLGFVSEKSNVQEKKSSVANERLKKVSSEAEQLEPKLLKQSAEDQSSSSGSNLENQIERIVEDCVHFEAHKIRQMLYSQQFMFNKQLTEIKKTMEQNYSENVNRLCNTIEELAQLNAELKYLNNQLSSQ